MLLHKAGLPPGRPFEAVKTNTCAQNVINVAIDAGVKKVIALSTDRAANPINLYGATKLVPTNFYRGNSYRSENTALSVRYGNVTQEARQRNPVFFEMPREWDIAYYRSV